MSTHDKLASLMILSTLLSGCVEQPVDDEIALLEEEDDDEAFGEAEGLRPFHVAVFDHEPTEEEIEEEFREFHASIGDLVVENDPVGLIGPNGSAYSVPAVGQKLVRIQADTSNISDAGTDATDAIRFTGHWQTNGAGGLYIESFLLNNPSVDDLDRNTTSVFYYLMNLGAYSPGTTQDWFVQGKIANVSTDGWHCDEVRVRDSNRFGTARHQSLAFNQWVDSPTVPESGWLPRNNPGGLSYN